MTIFKKKATDIQETKKAEQQWEEIQGKDNSVHIKLDSDVKLNCDKWVDEIVKRTVAQQHSIYCLQGGVCG